MAAPKTLRDSTPPETATRTRLEVTNDYPCMSEARFRRHDRAHPSLPLTELAAGLPQDALNYLAETLEEESMRTMGLSVEERAVLGLRLTGCSMRDVAERLGISKSRVEKALVRIRACYVALQGAHRSAAATGWQEVYLSETRRSGKPVRP